MAWPETLGIWGVAVALFLWAAIRERRPADPLRPRLLPTVPILMVAAVTILVMTAHLITLLTGQPFVGRSGW